MSRSWVGAGRVVERSFSAAVLFESTSGFLLLLSNSLRSLFSLMQFSWGRVSRLGGDLMRSKGTGTPVGEEGAAPRLLSRWLRVWKSCCPYGDEEVRVRVVYQDGFIPAGGDEG